ncbi:isocitrate lyase/phosphoenolpyruvate mutase family protein [Streptomyces sp. NPDC059740]|uniref:isocitrate lyase/PEP mutase family protein n=1 Tax=Streptomyces sp. NPDC059740 TaxID=3346926 RepID=UPI003665BEBC
MSADGAAAFRALHHGRAAGDPLVLPGPWDAGSAVAFAEAGFGALATPSAGVAASLGYEDGATPAEEMFAAVGRVVRAVAGRGVLVSADVEDGYGLAPAELAERLAEAGAVGCNVEDSDHAAGGLRDAAAHARWLAGLRAAVGDGLVVNARIDTYRPGGEWDEAAQWEETLSRARQYAAAGADCLYPIFAPPQVLARLAAEVDLPLNALARPGGPSPRELGELGARRVTFGPGLQRRAMAAVAEIGRELAGG